MGKGGLFAEARRAKAQSAVARSAEADGGGRSRKFREMWFTERLELVPSGVEGNPRPKGTTIRGESSKSMLGSNPAIQGPTMQEIRFDTPVELAYIQ